MKRLFFFAVAAILAGCTVTLPPLEGTALQQVRASITPTEGEIKFSRLGAWIPNSKEYKFKDGGEAELTGVVTVTEKSLLFQQWGGPTGLTTVKRIAIAEIQDTSIITFGVNKRLVVRAAGVNYDSFNIAGGGFVDGAGTTYLYEVLSALVKK